MIKIQPVSCLIYLRQWFSNSSSKISNTNLTWEFVRNVNSQPTFNPLDQKLLGAGLSNQCFKMLSRWFRCALKFENHCINVSISLNCTSLLKQNKKSDSAPSPYLPFSWEMILCQQDSFSPMSFRHFFGLSDSYFYLLSSHLASSILRCTKSLLNIIYVHLSYFISYEKIKLN